MSHSPLLLLIVLQFQDDPCVICLDGTVYDDNEIIFCEKCGIAVHQSCYGVSVIPEDAW
jgi:hypothetical protein